jgi:hypothetical protein
MSKSQHNKKAERGNEDLTSQEGSALENLRQITSTILSFWLSG